jgi:hypothetical protein
LQFVFVVAVARHAELVSASVVNKVVVKDNGKR